MRKSTAQVKNYASLYFRLIRETILLNKKQIAFITALDLSSALGGGAVLVVIAKIIDSFNTGEPIQSFFFTIPIESNLSYLTILFVLILALLLFSAIAQYFSKKFNRKLGREYCIKCTQEVVDSVTRMKGLSLKFKNAKGPVYLNQLSMRDTLHASLAMENVVYLIRPSLYAFVALLIVIKLDPYLTFILLPASMIILPVLLFRQSRGILSNSKDFYDKLRIARGQAISEAIRHSNSYELKGLGAPEIKVTDIKSHAFTKFLDSFDNNQLANDRVLLTISVFRAIFLSGTLFILGYFSIEGSRSWGSIAAYIGALYFLSNSVQNIIGFGTNLNRFYPQLKNLYEFLDSINQSQTAEVNGEAKRVASFPIPESLTISVDAELPDSLQNLDININETMFLVSGVNLSRLSLDVFTNALASAGIAEEVLENSLSFISKDFSADMFSCQVAEVRKKLFKNSGFLNYVFKHYPKIKDEILNYEIGQADVDVEQNSKRLSTKARNILLLNSLLEENALIKLVDMQMLRQLPPDVVIFFANSLADCYLAIACDSGRLIDTVVGHVLVIKEGKLIAAGSREWFAREKEKIGAKVFESQQPGGAGDNASLLM